MAPPTIEAGEVAVGEHPDVEERFTLRQHRVDDEERKRRDEHDRRDANGAGGEPILLLAAIQQVLQRADEHREVGESQPVHAARLDRRVRNMARGEKERQHANRHVDVEVPAPVDGLGEPPPDGGPEDGRDHHAHAPDRERLAALVHRIAVDHDGLRQWHERSAEYALQQAKEHDFRQRRRDPA